MKYILVAIISFLVSFGALCQNVYNSSTSLKLEENIKTPSVPSKNSAAVGRHIQTIKKKFDDKGFHTKTVRNGEVLLLTIPVDKLFGANRTELLSQASQTLGYLRQAIVHPESYRIIVAVYADDTGDDEYTLELTKKRADAIRDALIEISDGTVATNIDYYWFGAEEFAVPNNSIQNRAKNRRVEVYIVPEKQIISRS